MGDCIDVVTEEETPTRYKFCILTVTPTAKTLEIGFQTKDLCIIDLGEEDQPLWVRLKEDGDERALHELEVLCLTFKTDKIVYRTDSGYTTELLFLGVA